MNVFYHIWSQKTRKLCAGRPQGQKRWRLSKENHFFDIWPTSELLASRLSWKESPSVTQQKSARRQFEIFAKGKSLRKTKKFRQSILHIKSYRSWKFNQPLFVLPWSYLSRELGQIRFTHVFSESERFEQGTVIVNSSDVEVRINASLTVEKAQWLGSYDRHVSAAIIEFGR
jgi:hypothetical protein